MSRLAPFALGFLAAAGFGRRGSAKRALGRPRRRCQCQTTRQLHLSGLRLPGGATAGVGLRLGRSIPTTAQSAAPARRHDRRRRRFDQVHVRPAAVSRRRSQRRFASGTWAKLAARHRLHGPVDQADQAAAPGPRALPQNAAGRTARAETLIYGAAPPKQPPPAGLGPGLTPPTARSRAAPYQRDPRRGGIVHLTRSPARIATAQRGAASPRSGTAIRSATASRAEGLPSVSSLSDDVPLVQAGAPCPFAGWGDAGG